MFSTNPFPFIFLFSQFSITKRRYPKGKFTLLVQIEIFKKKTKKNQVGCVIFHCLGGHVHKPRGGESENPRRAETVAGGRLGPHHPAEAGFLRN